MNIYKLNHKDKNRLDVESVEKIDNLDNPIFKDIINLRGIYIPGGGINSYYINFDHLLFKRLATYELLEHIIITHERNNIIDSILK